MGEGASEAVLATSDNGVRGGAGAARAWRVKIVLSILARRPRYQKVAGVLSDFRQSKKLCAAQRTSG